MSARKRCLMVGAGGMAETWIRQILPRFSERLEIVGLVDVSERALAQSGDFLELPDDQRFTGMDAAFDAVDADFCLVVIPAAFHKSAAAGEQNRWRHEAYRVQCERGSVSVGSDQMVCVHRHTRAGGLETQEIAATQPRHEAHAWVLDEFLTWLDGGPTPATTLDDNIRTAATISARSTLRITVR
ncbi:MAG: Gfo/Idh/MocA family oxidoreductase [Chloroflexi bacterium]|nr:Gfo/Idh/MocA family oxidoreductase [Chloroflexota bacterium]